MSNYALRKELSAGYDEVLARLPDALKSKGFGILTEIDVKETLKKKLNADFRRYKILGACNPPFAHRALQAELEIGVLLPCNVIVYEADGGRAVVAAVDPIQTVAAHGNPAVREIAGEVRTRLERVLSRLE